MAQEVWRYGACSVIWDEVASERERQAEEDFSWAWTRQADSEGELGFFKAQGLSVDLLRQAVNHTRQKLDTSERRTCRVIGMSQSTLHYQATKKNNEGEPRLAVIRLAKQYGRHALHARQAKHRRVWWSQNCTASSHERPPPNGVWEKRINDRFNGTLRREALNAEWFYSAKQAQNAINIWLKQYNQIRPNHALNIRPLVPKTLLEKSKSSGLEKWG